MKSQVTLKMIAQKLNLSTSTVSRALADQWDVNSQTKKIVTDLAIELNYKPNIMAVKLKQCQKQYFVKFHAASAANPNISFTIS